MNMKSGLLGLSLFAAAGMLTISCGGGDEDGGKGTAGKGGGGSSAGSGSPGTSGSATGGTGNNTGGSNTGGTGNNTGGTGNNTGGTGNNTGGTGNATGGTGNNNEGGNDNGPNCPPAQPTDGAACTESTGQQGCDYAGDINCRCQRTFGQGPGNGGGGQGAGVTRAWNCEEDDNGGGNEGGGPNFGDVDCPDEKPADEATCTGTGFCPYQGGGCVCINGTFNCL